MTAFYKVWLFTCTIGLIGDLSTVNLAGSKRGVPDRATKSLKLFGLRPPNLHVLHAKRGLKPFSTDAGARLGIFLWCFLPESNRLLLLWQ